MGKFILEVVRTRDLLFLAVAGACLAFAVAYGALAPDYYRATATLFVDSTSSDSVTPNGGGAARATDLDLLRSERVAQRVVENERLALEPGMRRLYLQSIDSHRLPSEALAQYLVEHLDVRASGDGGLVHLGVWLSEPQLAARVANAYAQAWNEVSQELHAASIRNAVERAREDLVSLRARLGEARARRATDAPLAHASSRADEQFAQLSRFASQPLPIPLAAPVSVATGPEWEHGILAPLPAEAVNIARAEGIAPTKGSGETQLTSPSVHQVPALGERLREDASASLPPDEEVRFAQQSLERAEERLTRLAVDGVGAPFPAHLLRAAQTPEYSTKPGMPECAAIGAALGVVLGLLASAIAELSDRRVRRASDLAVGLGIVVLGNLPAVARRAMPLADERGSAFSRLPLQRA